MPRRRPAVADVGVKPPSAFEQALDDALRTGHLPAVTKPHDQQIIHSSKEPNYRTPLPLYERLDREFVFAIDLAATHANALVGVGDLAIYIGPDHKLPECRDALDIGFPLLASLSAQRKCLPLMLTAFCNPPYSRKLEREYRAAGQLDLARAMNVANWAERFWEESQRGLTIVGLFPFAPQTQWYRRYVYGITDEGLWAGFAASEERRIPHRVSFLSPEGAALDNAGVNHAVIVWRPDPGYVGPWQPSVRYWDYL